MKRTFTYSKRFAVMAALLLTSALSVLAGSDYYAYKTEVKAYPTGKGFVYVNTEDPGSPIILDEVSADAWKESITFEETSTMGTFYCAAKPAEGYVFAGFIEDYYDVDTEEVTESDFISVTKNPGSLERLNGVTKKGADGVAAPKEEVEALMPMDPQNYFRAVFAKVAVNVAEDNSYLGTATISKIVNDTGDELTLTATPADEKCSFDYWEVNGNGEKYSVDPEIHITATHPEVYTAHFKHTSDVTLDFGEGKLIPFICNDADCYLPEGVETYTISADSTQASTYGDANTYFTKPIVIDALDAPYYWAGYMDLLYAKGKKTIKAWQTENYSTPSKYSTMQWSGKEGINVDTITVDVPTTYYKLDAENMCFNRVTGLLAPETPYLQLPTSTFDKSNTTTPDVIVIDVNAVIVDGIKDVKASKGTTAKRIYDLQGRRRNNVDQKGVYVFDGKKVYLRK